nr:hypothetical protein [Phytohabitans flavus]
MPGVEHDEAHSAEHPGRDAVDKRVVGLVVRGVTPPEEHVGLFE